MTITARQADILRKRVRQLVEAEVAFTNKNTENASPFKDYDEALRVARKRYNEYISALRLDDFRRAP